MTFRETINKLVEETENYEVMACIAYSDAKTDIGIRRSTGYDTTMRDPIIEGEWFMICGDIYSDINTPKSKRMDSMKELSSCELNRLAVHLYADYGSYLGCATIGLGYYEVLNRQVITYDDLFGWPRCIKLTLKRKD